MEQDKLNLAFDALNQGAISKEEFAHIAYKEGLISVKELNNVIVPKETGILPETPFSAVASVGQEGAKGLGMLGDLVGPKTGNAVKKGAELIYPQNELQALFALGGLKAPQAAGELMGKPEVAKGLSSILSVPNAVRPHNWEQFLKNPSEVMNAPAMPEAMAQYGKDVGGLPGIKNAGGSFESLLSRTPAQIKENVGLVADNLGAANDTELLQAYQGANQLLRKNLRSHPDVMPYTQDLLRAKNVIEQELGTRGTDVASAGSKYAKSIAKEDLSSLLPKNTNQSPNALRSMALLWTLKHGLTGGASLPAAMAEAAAMSPFFASRGLYYGGKAVAGASPFGASALGGILGKQNE